MTNKSGPLWNSYRGYKGHWTLKGNNMPRPSRLPRQSVFPAKQAQAIPRTAANDNPRFRLPGAANDNHFRPNRLPAPGRAVPGSVKLPKIWPSKAGILPALLRPAVGFLRMGELADGLFFPPPGARPIGPGPGWVHRHGPNRYDPNFYKQFPEVANPSASYVGAGTGPQTGVISGQSIPSYPLGTPAFGGSSHYSLWNKHLYIGRGAQHMSWRRNTQIGVRAREIVPIVGPGDLQIFPYPYPAGAADLAASVWPWLPVPAPGTNPGLKPFIAPGLAPWQRPIQPGLPYNPAHHPANRPAPTVAPLPLIGPGLGALPDYGAGIDPVNRPNDKPARDPLQHRKHDPRRKPKRFERERKMGLKQPAIAMAAFGALGVASEAGDAIEAAWGALPAKKKQWSFHDGRPVKPSKAKMAVNLFRNWGDVDLEQFAQNMVVANAQDVVIGKLSSVHIPGVADGHGMSSGWSIGAGENYGALNDSNQEIADEAGAPWWRK